MMDYGNSKKNIVLVVLVVLLGLFVVGLGGYLIYEKVVEQEPKVEDNKPSNDDEKTDDKQDSDDKNNDRDTAIDVDINSREVTDNMELLFGKSEDGIYPIADMQFGSELYQNELSVSQLSDVMIANLVYRYALKNGFVDKNDIDQINAAGNGTFVSGVIPVSYFKMGLEAIFGDKITYHNFNEYGSSNSTGGYCPNAYYHSESGTYRIYEGCGGFAIPMTYTKVVSATKDREKMEIVVQAMFMTWLDGNHVSYSNFDREHPFYEDNSGAMEVSQVFSQYSSSIDQYCYTFNRDNNGDYHFYEVKKINS